MVATHPTNPSHEYERETTHARSTHRNRNAKLEINTSRTFTSNVFDLSNPIQPGCIRTHRFSHSFQSPLFHFHPRVRDSLPPNRIFQPKNVRFPKTLRDLSIPLHPSYTSARVCTKKKSHEERRKERIVR